MAVAHLMGRVPQTGLHTVCLVSVHLALIALDAHNSREHPGCRKFIILLCIISVVFFICTVGMLCTVRQQRFLNRVSRQSLIDQIQSLKIVKVLLFTFDVAVTPDRLQRFGLSLHRAPHL